MLSLVDFHDPINADFEVLMLILLLDEFLLSCDPQANAKKIKKVMKILNDIDLLIFPPCKFPMKIKYQIEIYKFSLNFQLQSSFTLQLLHDNSCFRQL